MAEERLALAKGEKPTNRFQPRQKWDMVNKPSVVGRMMTSIYTKSTLPYDPNNADYETKWILSIKDDGKSLIGIILLDISTL